MKKNLKMGEIEYLFGEIHDGITTQIKDFQIGEVGYFLIQGCDSIIR